MTSFPFPSPTPLCISNALSFILDVLIFSSANVLLTHPFVHLLILSYSWGLAVDANPYSLKAYNLVVLSHGLCSGWEGLGFWFLSFWRSQERMEVGEPTKWAVYKHPCFPSGGYPEACKNQVIPGPLEHLDPLLASSSLCWGGQKVLWCICESSLGCPLPLCRLVYATAQSNGITDFWNFC